MRAHRAFFDCGAATILRGMTGPTPRDIPPQLQQARMLMEQSRINEAADVLRRYVAQKPKEIAAYGPLCHAMLLLGNPAQALYYARQAKRLEPYFAEIWAAEARALQYSNKRDEARAVLDEAMERFPRNAAIGEQLVELHLHNSNYAGVDDVCSKAQDEGWMSEAMAAGHSAALHKLGDVTRATEWARSTQWKDPTNIAAAGILATTLVYDGAATAEQVAAAHRRIGMLYHDTLGHLARPVTRGKDDATRALRIGVISPDLRQHSVAAFALALYEGLRLDGSTVTTYYTGFTGDAITQRFRERSHVFRVCGDLGPTQLFDQIVADRIDVLLELSGHTTNNRLHVLALKPAPVIISAIGYPATTGMRTVDFRLVDEITDPPGCEGLLTEQALRIGAPFLCYAPPADVPEVDATPPSLRAGAKGVTFAAFNALHKINAQTLGMWASVMRELPGSRLLVKAAASKDHATQRRAIERFVAAGMAESHVEWLSHVPGQRAHLETYNQCDISLDPWPYHGTTSSCESMLMGVPVVTRVGEAHVSRVGLTLARCVGNEDLCAGSVEAFVGAAVGLARDGERLRRERATLRERLKASALCDSADYARRVSQGVRDAWTWYCQPG
jgi:protein O-GlcNAc transferase